MHEAPVQSGSLALETEAGRDARSIDATTNKPPQSILDFLSRLSRSYTESGTRDRASMAVALLSVVFQSYQAWGTESVKAIVWDRDLLDFLAVGIFLTAIMSLSARASRLGVAIFLAIALTVLIPDWRVLANHVYLALWTIPVAILFKEWWRSDLYAFYLRMTLGIVMIAAFSQKILAGTYIDGSYIAYLSSHGSSTERMFSFLCDNTSPDPCRYYQFIAIFILAWQLAVGILLILGLNSILFLAIETGFLLGAGVYADEMNFQVLNIALLCIVFRFGMPLWLAAVCVILLALDVFHLSNIVDLVMRYAA
jgi:hypothetical protein